MENVFFDPHVTMPPSILKSFSLKEEQVHLQSERRLVHQSGRQMRIAKKERLMYTNGLIRKHLGGTWLVAAILLGIGAGAVSAAENNSYADLAAKVKHSVVNVATTMTVEGPAGLEGLNPSNSPLEEFFNRFFGGMPRTRREANALGSGLLIDDLGLILTNNHVVEKADKISVILQNQNEFDAEVVGRDPKTDLALIRIASPSGRLPQPASLGDSDAMRVGDGVMAVGNPFGLGHTVTVGIISAKGRVLGAGPYDDFLQTDAAINPGNSGGPLFNMQGEVIGINTAIVAGGQGIGFAVPINLVKELLPQLKTGSVTRGWMGVVIQDLTPELAESFGLEANKGALVADVVQGGPADQAGLTRGDVIQSVDGKPVETAHELSRLVATNKPQSKIALDILRDGQKETVKVRIGEMPTQETAQLGGKDILPDQGWGMAVQPLTPDLAQHLGLDESESGAVVAGIKPDSPAGEADLRSGDIIKEIDRKPIQNREDVVRAIEQSKGKAKILLLVKREGKTVYVVLKTNGNQKG
jgi:serine protease Do